MVADDLRDHEVEPLLGELGVEVGLGGEAAQLSLGVSDKVTRVFQGLLLFFVLSCDTLINYKIRMVWADLTDTVKDGGAN